MATQRANGGVVRRWETPGGTFRLVLCANGRFLISGGAGVWRHWKEPATVAQVEGDPRWREVARWERPS
jgi:hypothetical protein